MRSFGFIAVLIAGMSSAFGQAPQPPYALFQNATLSGSGNTITATQVPVVTAPGITVYVNFTIQFNPDATGNLTMVPGSLQVALAPGMIASSFKAGTYVSGSTTLGGKAVIVVSGPAITDGGATVWTIATPAGADPCTFPSNATWYVGPIATSPYATRLKAAGLTSTVYSYGVEGISTCTPSDGAWRTQSLLGFTQVGNTLTIATFTGYPYGSNTDYATTVTQVTYTLKQ